jgi:hypothetical protein
MPQPAFSVARPAKTQLAVALLLVAAAAQPADAAISGFVRRSDTNQPVANARVHIQADLASPVAISAGDGSFSLAVSPVGSVQLTAAVPYDATASDNFHIGGIDAMDGDTNVIILVDAIPSAAAVGYVPPNAVQGCSGCHARQFSDWQTSSHALAATDAWVHDLHSGTGTPGTGGNGYVYLNTHDPGETGNCATCHAPLEDVFTPGQLQFNAVSSDAGLDGVTCLACHQLTAVDNDHLDGLHYLPDAGHPTGKSTYRFPAEKPTEISVWGPFDDVSYGGMRATYSPLHTDSRICAACHQYKNPETGAPGQNTYREWLASSYALPGPNFKTCQTCHFPPEVTDGPICKVLNLDRPASQRLRHLFPGADQAGLSGAILLHLSATEQQGGIAVQASVENAGAGHNFPTGIGIRNALLVLDATVNGQPLQQISGPAVPWWADDNVAGTQPGDYAGLPGTGFAKLLEGRVNYQGPTVAPVLFVDAEGVREDSTIPAGTASASSYVFQLPPGAQLGDTVTIQARLLYRRAWRALAVTKGWTVTPQGGPIEIEVANQTANVTVTPLSLIRGIVEVPTLAPAALFALVAALALSAVWVTRRRRGAAGR